jgi:hypothetical protein
MYWSLMWWGRLLPCIYEASRILCNSVTQQALVLS